MRKHGRPRQPLTDLDVKKLRKPGRYGDARNGLYLAVSETGAKSWLFIGTKHGKRHVKGLGNAANLSLKAARAEAARLAAALDNNIAPEKAVERRAREKAQAAAAKAGAVTFGEVAEEVFRTSFQSWSEKHERQWRLTLDVYCAPLWHLPIPKIGTPEILQVLGPVWTKKTESAVRIRSRLERILDYAQAKDYRSGDNPARWKGKLQVLLPKPKPMNERVQHFSAMPYADVPAFLVELRKQDSVPAKALEFAILTAGRSGEVLLAKWPEIDFDNRLWTIPAARMKASREHQVPLSEPALALLRRMAGQRMSEFVFPGYATGRPPSPNQLPLPLRRLGYKYTAHGFRSSFRDWCGDCTPFPREVAEAALAHSIGDQTERAYRRGHALERRRELMAAWANYCEPKTGNNVVAMRSKPIPA
jgi:integrase